MSEFELLTQFTELSILNTLLKRKYAFARSTFEKKRSLIDRAAEKGVSVSGCISGAYVGKDYYGLGPITAIFISRLLIERLGIYGATNIPIGFSYVHGPKNRGAIACQFPTRIPSNMVAEQADADVVHDYIWTSRPALKGIAHVPYYDVPCTAVSDVIRQEKIGRNITEYIDYDRLPPKYYVRLAGTADDLDMIEEISAEDGRSCTRYPEEGCCVISNIDLLGFPPLPEFLPFTSFDRGPAGNRKSQNKIGQLPPPVRGNTIPIIPDVPDLPGVWFFFTQKPCQRTYEALSDGDFTRVVSKVSKKTGTNKYSGVRRILDVWQVGTEKSYGDLLKMLRGVVGENEHLQAKLLCGLRSHLRISAKGLTRVSFQTNEQ